MIFELAVMLVSGFFLVAFTLVYLGVEDVKAGAWESSCVEALMCYGWHKFSATSTARFYIESGKWVTVSPLEAADIEFHLSKRREHFNS